MLLANDLDSLLRMGLAVVCGLAVGYNRAHTPSHRRSRLRVHVLVGLSACLMVLAAGPDPQAHSRVIQGVATGVGFLGAGEILVTPRELDRRGLDQLAELDHPTQVRGLTSAASIWFTAALGLTAATSKPLLALVALGLALLVLFQTENGANSP